MTVEGVKDETVVNGDEEVFVAGKGRCGTRLCRWVLLCLHES